MHVDKSFKKIQEVVRLPPHPDNAWILGTYGTAAPLEQENNCEDGSDGGKDFEDFERRRCARVRCMKQVFTPFNKMSPIFCGFRGFLFSCLLSSKKLFNRE